MASFTSIDTSVSLRSDTSPWSHFRDFWALLKPRVMSLVVFTGFVGMFLAPGELHYVLQIVAIICIAVLILPILLVNIVVPLRSINILKIVN